MQHTKGAVKWARVQVIGFLIIVAFVVGYNKGPTTERTTGDRTDTTLTK